jgi:hypothetical protein
MAVAKVRLPAAKGADWILVSRCMYIPQRATGHVSYSTDISNQYLQGVGGLRHCTLVKNSRLYVSGRFEIDRLCGLVVRVLGYRSRGPGLIPGTTRKKK